MDKKLMKRIKQHHHGTTPKSHETGGGGVETTIKKTKKSEERNARTEVRTVSPRTENWIWRRGTDRKLQKEGENA